MSMPYHTILFEIEKTACCGAAATDRNAVNISVSAKYDNRPRSTKNRHREIRGIMIMTPLIDSAISLP